MTETRSILDALRRRHEEPRNGLARAWIYVEEVRVSTGFSGSAQSIDAFALHTWPSKKYRRVAYEVKASRSDLRRELEQPWKCEAALGLSNQFYLVIPTGLLEGIRIPDEWGIIEYVTTEQMVLADGSSASKGRLYTERGAPWRDTETPPYSFMLSVARNLQAKGES